MASQHRSSSYTNEEDLHLCHVYLDISQNSIVGINQSKDEFWAIIEYDYNNSQLEFTITQPRPKRLLQCRVQVILTAVGKLRGCVQQVENLNPSGASEQDIMPNIKKDLNLIILNNPTSTFQRQFDNFASSQSKLPTSESLTSATPGLSDFSLNMNDEEIGGSSTQRPIGVKKAKLKRKNDEQITTIVDTIKEENQKLVEILKKGNSDRQQSLDQNYQMQI
ncbi:hypothetical protein UlMin_029570 [Ulmus minor]